jgi:uncharacterized membrane protein
MIMYHAAIWSGAERRSDGRARMGKGRLEAFTDGVIAIIITIMVLELKVPHGTNPDALAASVPVFLAYVLSFVNVGIFWVNHHHMLHAADRIHGGALWANLFLLFWLTLVPFVIRWIDEAGFAALPTAAYGAVLGMSGFGYWLLQQALIRDGHNAKLAKALGSDFKGRMSLAMYASSVPLAFITPWISIALYVAVALMWFIPDRRIESLVE